MIIVAAGNFGFMLDSEYSVLGTAPQAERGQLPLQALPHRLFSSCEWGCALVAVPWRLTAEGGFWARGLRELWHVVLVVAAPRL